MSYRYYLCPVVNAVEINPDNGKESVYRAPKVHLYIDPSKGKSYSFSAAIDTANWCIACVHSNDFSALDADPEVINLFESDFVDVANSDELFTMVLQKRLRTFGWDAAKLDRLRARLQLIGVDIASLSLDSSLETILDRAMQKIAPFFRARSTWVK